METTTAVQTYRTWLAARHHGGAFIAALANAWILADPTNRDSFGELDLSNSGGKSGAIGCMIRRLADLDAEEQRLLAQLRFVRTAQRVALEAMDRFIVAPAQVGE